MVPCSGQPACQTIFIPILRGLGTKKSLVETMICGQTALPSLWSDKPLIDMQQLKLVSVTYLAVK